VRTAHSITHPDGSDSPRASATRPVAATDYDAAERAVEAFNAHDLAGLAATLADDVVCRTPGGVEEEGKAACVEFHRRWLADFPDARVGVRAWHLSDHVVVEEGTFRGTHDGVAPTGQSVSLDYMRVVRVEDGKQVTLSLMLDRLLMLEQLDLVTT
jgi:ketosteroid isomerase-like protein